jgi:hypothetical protein
VAIRRLLVLLAVLAVVGVPAGVLQALCVGRSCVAAIDGSPRVPFCPLDPTLRELIANGYRDGRSADVLGVTGDTPVFTELGGTRVAWPSVNVDTRVPVAFWGSGIAPGVDEPEDVGLDRIAPTVSEILSFDRPFPDVRSGEAIEGVAARTGSPPRLVLLIAWASTGTADLEDHPNAWPYLRSLMDEGVGTLDATTGSLPLDPAATLTTIGTGGLPSQHGITGSFLRNDEPGSADAGEVHRAFGSGAPIHVIATLADDLEEHADPRTLVGLVATDERDRGLLGGGWYPGQDPVDIVIGDAAAAGLAVDVYLESGYGADPVSDVLGVVLRGGIERLDRLTRGIVRSTERATDGSVLVVVAGTGTTERHRIAVPDTTIVDAVEDAVPGNRRVVEATVAGGVYLDRDVLTETAVTGRAAADAMLDVTGSNGEAMMVDAFQGFAVSFSRYC